MLSRLALPLVVIMSSFVSHAATAPRETVSKEKQRETISARSGQLENLKSMKADNLTLRVHSGASRIVSEAGKSGSAETLRLAQSLEIVTREKLSIGLSESSMPEKTVGDVLALMKDGKTVNEAMAESLEKNGANKERLLECAGK